jgi:subtilase family serine protease
VDFSAEYIVDNNLAGILSDSYGECELGLGTTGNQFYGQLWEQAAAEGITVLVASGDQGSAACDYDASDAINGLAVNGLASTPWNVAAGGTDFNQYNQWSQYWNATNASLTQGSALGYIPEMTWNESCTNTTVLDEEYS